MFWAWIALCFLTLVKADLYLHSPRGSNNRLAETSRRVENTQRLFDSQNTFRSDIHGGYNVGERHGQRQGQRQGGRLAEEDQYMMKYFQSGAGGDDDASYMHIEWTSDNGCTGSTCNLVLQYMCQEDPEDEESLTGRRAQQFRNGDNTQSQAYIEPRYDNRESESSYRNRQNRTVHLDRGLHESMIWFDKCATRDRNQGLFTADQTLTESMNTARNTRQNPSDTRFGYECPEERDYWPYWHPSPWKDAAYFGLQHLSDNYERCRESYNVKAKHECVETWANSNEPRHYSKHNNQAACEENNGSWEERHSFLEKAPEFTTKVACMGTNVNYVWAVPYDTTDGTKECLVQTPPVDCIPAQSQRGNSPGYMQSYQWKIPYFPSGTQQRCIVRLRYNITTGDELGDARNDASSNVNIIEDTVTAAGVPNLKLAINTAQFGRTFQDRSHVLLFAPRPHNMANGRLFNLNVRGKRGNIQQTFPAVEYDFTPDFLAVKPTDMVHIQWTGSNRNPGRNDGNGIKGSDRHNLLQLLALDQNYPMEEPDMFDGATIMWTPHQHGFTSKDIAVSMASSGYYMCAESLTCPREDQMVGTKGVLQDELNNALPSYAGMVLKFGRLGMHHYMCTRNNDFSNRSQKGTIVVTTESWANGAIPYEDQEEAAARRLLG